MIAYREQRRKIPTAEAIRRIESASGLDRQIEFGEFEAGVADALSPEFDSDLPVLRALRRGEFHGLDLPPEIEVSVPEGFAYYAVDPDLYRRAARQFAQEAASGRVAVIGIRSIGTTLSTVVAEELRRLGCAVDSWTVRPRGHPWNRELRVAAGLARLWRDWGGSFAVVDEGPGLSGSSFAAVSCYLESLGIPPARVSLFPSWLPDGSQFVSENGRRRWALHRKFAAPFEDLNLFPGAVNLSAGKWRDLRGLEVAVQPQHERRKYLAGSWLHKFAGYGRYGRASRERADVLREFVPPHGALQDGFLAVQWMEAQLPTPEPAFLDHAARYLAFVRRQFATGAPVAFEPLAELIAVNAPGAPDLEPWRGAVCDGHAVVLDARMFPHEWLQTAGGYRKADALDHGDDHFFPGPQDTAWDLAACSVEFDLSPAAEDWLLDRYAFHSQDRDARARLPFYRLAYLAFRLGYADLAGESFRCERARYQRLLEACYG